MKKEIEHKFLVEPAKLPKLRKGRRMVQGYLSTNPTVRVRIVSNREAYITIKGSGLLARDEFEYSIPASDARRLLKLCGGRIVEKIRHFWSGWEIDKFLGRHKGLWLAEYELKSTRAKLPQLPEWVGREVTGEPEYTNAALAMNENY